MGPLQVKVKKATEVYFDEEMGTYPLKSSPKGLSVIINYENYPNKSFRRYVSHIDVENLKNLCE